MRTSTKILLLHIFCVVFPIVSAQQPYLAERWQIISLGEGIGGSGLCSIDLNNDGTEEIVLETNSSGGTSFCVLEVEENEFIVRYASRLYNLDGWFTERIKRLRVYDLDGDDLYEIYVLCENGLFECIDGTTFETTLSVQLDEHEMFDFALEDIDLDGTTELVLTRIGWMDDSRTAVYSFPNMDLEWDSDTFGDRSMCIGDVDNDNIPELVLPGGLVIDGITKNVDWNYGDGFGQELDLVDLDGDGSPEIIAGIYDYIRAFHGQAKEQLWEIFTDRSLGGILAEDINDDEVVEVVLGDYNFDGLFCFSTETLELLWQADDGEANITRIVLGDPDNDGDKELVWGTGQGSTGPDRLVVTNAVTGELEKRSDPIRGYFSIGLSANPMEGHPDVGITCYEVNQYMDGGWCMLYGGLDQILLDVLDTITYTSPIGSFKMANINATPQDELIIGYVDGYGYKSIQVLDALTHTELYDENEFGSIYAMETGDIDDDGTVEIVFGQWDGEVAVLSGETFELEWQTNEINWMNSIRQVLLENIDEDPALEILFWARYDQRIHIWDGVSQEEQAVSEEYPDMTCIEVADLNFDGVKEICMADLNGHVTAFDPSLENIIEQFYLQEEPIRCMTIGNIDHTPGPEILTGGMRFRVFSGQNHVNLWETRILNQEGYNFFKHQSIQLADIDENGFMDVYWAGERGVFRFECSNLFSAVADHPDPAGKEILYPNPAAHELFVKIPHSSSNPYRILMYDLTGKKIKDLNVYATDKISISTETLPAGVYILEINAGSRMFRKKFVRQ